jgi:hypothetical protein
VEKFDALSNELKEERVISEAHCEAVASEVGAAASNAAKAAASTDVPKFSANSSMAFLILDSITSP